MFGWVFELEGERIVIGVALVGVWVCGVVHRGKRLRAWALAV